MIRLSGVGQVWFGFPVKMNPGWWEEHPFTGGRMFPWQRASFTKLVAPDNIGGGGRERCCVSMHCSNY